MKTLLFALLILPQTAIDKTHLVVAPMECRSYDVLDARAVHPVVWIDSNDDKYSRTVVRAWLHKPGVVRIAACNMEDYGMSFEKASIESLIKILLKDGGVAPLRDPIMNPVIFKNLIP